MKSIKLFYISIPGVSGPLTVKGIDEKSARQSARDRLGYGKRLPAGTRLYPIVTARG